MTTLWPNQWLTVAQIIICGSLIWASLCAISACAHASWRIGLPCHLSGQQCPPVGCSRLRLQYVKNSCLLNEFWMWVLPGHDLASRDWSELLVSLCMVEEACLSDQQDRDWFASLSTKSSGWSLSNWQNVEIATVGLVLGSHAISCCSQEPLIETNKQTN